MIEGIIRRAGGTDRLLDLADRVQERNKGVRVFEDESGVSLETYHGRITFTSEDGHIAVKATSPKAFDLVNADLSGFRGHEVFALPIG